MAESAPTTGQAQSQNGEVFYPNQEVTAAASVKEYENSIPEVAG